MFYGNINESVLQEGKFLDFIKERKRKKQEEKERQEKIKKQQEQDKKQAEYWKQIKEEFRNMSSEEKKSFNDFYNKKEKEFETIAKEELRKLMNDSKFKETLLKDIKDAFDKGILDPEYHKRFYNTSKLPKVHVKNCEDYWEIIDEDQDVSIACSIICETLADILEDKTEYTIGTGDGDEGCIYPHELIDPVQFYALVYTKK